MNTETPRVCHIGAAIEKRVSNTEKSITDTQERLRLLEQQVGLAIYDADAIKELVLEIKLATTTITADINTLQRRPFEKGAERWDKAVEVAIAVLVTAVISFFLGGHFLG